MRGLRRFAIALLGVLLLPITPLGASASCAASGSRPLADAAHVVPDGAAATVAPGDAVHDHDEHAQSHRGAAPDVPHPGHEPGPGHHPGDVSCPTSTACASVAAAGRTPGLTASGAPAGNGVVSVDVSGPASVVLAPEPPPPRLLRA